MFNKNENLLFERLKISLALFRHGILVNFFNGRMKYYSHVPKCYCKEISLIRHGKTLAVERNEFMSDTSSNSALSSDGIKEVKLIGKQLKANMPDVVLVAPLRRTRATFNIIKNDISDDVECKVYSELRGINNSLWAEKTFEMLDSENLYIFLRRECDHNIFYKTENGDSWGDVLLRCTKILKTLNRKYKSKKVLLISQGSIYQGFAILLHKDDTPWSTYSATKMFNISQSNTLSSYGKLVKIFPQTKMNISIS